jgi:predicted ferric reductase
MNASSGSLYLTRPDVLLRLEGLLELVVGCIAYQRLYPHHWGIFAVLFLAPDISLLGYLRSASKASAVFYNLVHSYVLPLALGLLAWKLGSALGGQLALIWLAHISFDRCLGFGLKFPESFRVTHIQRSEAIDLTALSGKT